MPSPLLLAWFRRHREAEQRAEQLIGELGAGAYSEARRCEREALDDESAAHWRRVALLVARMTVKREGRDKSERLFMI
jgi:hypothetical protein